MPLSKNKEATMSESKRRDIIAQVKQLRRIEEVCSERGVELRACSNDRQEGCCPFHEDRTPSFSVYVQTQRYYCFGCGAQGDVIDFVRGLDRCSFQEAINRLLPSFLGVQQSKTAQKKTSHGEPVRSRRQMQVHPVQLVDYSEVLTQALAVYHETLLQMTPAQGYLAERGIERAAIERFRLGYSDGATLCLSLRGNERLWKQAQQAGLLTKTAKEWLTGRVIIPNVEGDRCTWMIGRALPSSLHPACKPKDKYLGLALPKPLLGYEAAQAAWFEQPWRSLQGILVVEGAIDYVLARAWGLPVLSVALLGTHPSRQQLQALLRLYEMTDLPFIDWHDADEPGRLGALHLLVQLGGAPVRLFPEIANVKDLADLGTYPDGYARLMQAWQAIGDGGEL